MFIRQIRRFSTFKLGPIFACSEILVNEPKKSLETNDPKVWNYGSNIKYDIALEQHNNFVKMIEELGVAVRKFPSHLNPSNSDSMFVHDPVLTIPPDGEYITLKMGKELREGEEGVMEGVLNDFNLKKLGEISGEGKVEGGDTLWV